MKTDHGKNSFYALLRNGVVDDCGQGDYKLQPGQSALEFETRKERALHPLVANWELRAALRQMESEVAKMKSEHAYAGKEYDAAKLYSNTVGGELPASFDYVGAQYPHLDIEVQAQGIEPLEAAKAILAAVRRVEEDDMGTLAVEARRVAIREQVKNIKQRMANG